MNGGGVAGNSQAVFAGRRLGRRDLPESRSEGHGGGADGDHLS
jgi:hypothetical protein